MEEKMTFKALNKDGVEVECEVLFTFESDETKKNYMVYTDNTTDENGNVRSIRKTQSEQQRNDISHHSPDPFLLIHGGICAGGLFGNDPYTGLSKHASQALSEIV